ncbi:hypothetical protein OHS33_34785 [Streptomyces sp. NBC_00536]|nr:hypothetical protein [Streptomyces sp. NBC_00536]WUC83085.1 hypothetical protein OHS33_34785 [Streptomyces sp. NBC_00536]
MPGRSRAQWRTTANSLNPRTALPNYANEINKGEGWRVPAR